MIPLLLSLIVPWVTGFFLVTLCSPPGEAVLERVVFKGALGAGIGMGVVSTAYFAWGILTVPSDRGFIVVELLLLAGSALAFWLLRGRRAGTPILPARKERRPPAPALHWILAAAFVAVLLVSIGSFTYQSLIRPHGAWDAWAVWDVRAKLLFRGVQGWMGFFSAAPAEYNPNYPLLVPGVVARSWLYAGVESVEAPILVAGFFTFATVGLLVSALSNVRSRMQGWLGGIALLGTSFFVRHGTSQYADVPLAFFVLSAAVLCFLYDREENGWGGHLVLAGMATGMASWTKNEGLLFLAAVIFTRAAWVAATRGVREALRQGLPLAAGMAPFVLISLGFKFFLAQPDNWLSQQGGEGTMAKVTDLSRYLLIAGSYIREFVLFPVPLAVLYALLVGIAVPGRERRAVAWPAALLVLMTAGYAFVFLTSPWPLPWLLTNTLSRTSVQLWPAFLFTMFLLVRPPDPEPATSPGTRKDHDRTANPSKGGRRKGRHSPTGDRR